MRAVAVGVDGAEGATLLLDHPQPVPAQGEVLIKVLRAGVCNTDLEICKGYMNFRGVLGHEFVGKVVSEGSALHGKRVCGEINLACRSEKKSCTVCERRDDMSRNHCPNRTVMGILGKDGCWAEYLSLPEANLHVIPECISDEAAVFVEPLAAACRILEQEAVVRGSTQRVAILGDGKLGLMVCEALGRAELKIKPTLFARHAERADLLKDVVDFSLVPPRGDTDTPQNALTEAAGSFDVVVDCTGSPQGLEVSRGLLRPMGTLVLKSTCAAAAGFDCAPFVIDELRLVGSRCGPFAKAIQLLAPSGTEAAKEDRVDVSKYVSASFPLEEVHQAIAKAQERGTLKVQLVMKE